MPYFVRELEGLVENWLFRGKVISLYGPRQVGKTTLAKKLLAKHGAEKHYYDCEFLHIREMLASQNPAQYEQLFKGAKLLVLDEAQQVEEIGIVLKLLHDHFPDAQIIATGSSSFELANKTSEPLTGRGVEFVMYPLAVSELAQQYRADVLLQKFEQLMMYGAYPEIINADLADVPFLLQNLTSKYLYKDILELTGIKKSDALVKLLQLLALQLGSEVSYHELAVSLQISPKTVEHYLDLLEKAFVIFRLKPFSRNLRKEITKKNKVYFFDLGVRNALLSQFAPLQLRSDVGGLWENFCVIERLKQMTYRQEVKSVYFWREQGGAEIDFLEESNGQLKAYDFKWQRPARVKIPRSFAAAYPGTSFDYVDKNNCLNFLLGE
jgi:predicted AAA+ superfamily ATPase